MMKKFGKTRRMKAYCVLLAIAVVCTIGLLPEVTVAAAGTPTSLGLAEHGIKAHRDGWVYVYGGKGQAVGDTRGSDCAGLLYAYFSDMGAVGRCQGGASGQVTQNCVFSNDISEGIPNIHGLALTMPDYVSPDSGLYGHIGIYIGNNEAADNSDTQFNMRREPVVGNTGRNWNAWHVFDNGLQYPVEGWYQLDGKLVHYTNYEYDADTVVDGFYLGSDGYAADPDGEPVPVSAVTLSTKYVSASRVAAYLATKYSGKDSTYELIYGNGGPSSSDWNGRITGSGVRLRSEPNTASAVLATLSKGAAVNILEEVTGETVSADGRSSNKWYSVTTAGGLKGYVCSLYAERVSTGPSGDPPAAPVITAADGYVVILSPTADADIYYTTDGSVPTESSTPYTQPVYLTGYTFKAVAVKNGAASPVTTATVLSNSSVFTDFVRTDWFYQAVDLAVSFGIFRGNGDGTLSPNGKITRAQFVVALAGLDKADLTPYRDGTSFSDLGKLPEKMRPAVEWAYQMGYVSGFGDDTFRPNDSISREQMCVILRKYAGLERDSSSTLFADDSRVSSWARDAVYACRDNGLISGMGDNLFAPQGTATRAQACVIMTKLYEK